MSRTNKLLLGVATLWPVVYMALFFAFFIYSAASIFSTEPGSTDSMDRMFGTIFVVHALTMLWIFGLLAVYIRLLFKTDRVPADKKALWAVVLFFGNMLAMPVFWYLYVWREPLIRDAV
ncbi:MAG TPA: hypothetical protein VFV09_02830 [Actinomycetota bacterium]|jgi:hypothetical protein|nr:hypothetical protein [Actinomycetota bacterium]